MGRLAVFNPHNRLHTEGICIPTELKEKVEELKKGSDREIGKFFSKHLDT